MATDSPRFVGKRFVGSWLVILPQGQHPMKSGQVQPPEELSATLLAGDEAKILVEVTTDWPGVNRKRARQGSIDPNAVTALGSSGT